MANVVNIEISKCWTQMLKKIPLPYCLFLIPYLLLNLTLLFVENFSTTSQTSQTSQTSETA